MAEKETEVVRVDAEIEPRPDAPGVFGDPSAFGGAGPGRRGEAPAFTRVTGRGPAPFGCCCLAVTLGLAFVGVALARLPPVALALLPLLGWFLWRRLTPVPDDGDDRRF